MGHASSPPPVDQQTLRQSRHFWRAFTRFSLYGTVIIGAVLVLLYLFLII